MNEKQGIPIQDEVEKMATDMSSTLIGSFSPHEAGVVIGKMKNKIEQHYKDIVNLKEDELSFAVGSYEEFKKSFNIGTETDGIQNLIKNY
jgi:hypothetical protein